jgi:hypothetical protein
VSYSTISRAIRGTRRAYRQGAPELAVVKEAISRNRERGARQRRRLEETDVAEVFRMRAVGVPLRRIAANFGVTHRTIMNILAGRIYRDCSVDGFEFPQQYAPVRKTFRTNSDTETAL